MGERGERGGGESFKLLPAEVQKERRATIRCKLRSSFLPRFVDLPGQKAMFANITPPLNFRAESSVHKGDH